MTAEPAAKVRTLPDPGLAAAGADIVVIREVGVRHGHLNEPGDPEAARSIDRIADWLLVAGADLSR
jgi:hypothetical protein